MSGCQAAVPLTAPGDAIEAWPAAGGPGIAVGLWAVCGEPATANYTYLCACGIHLVNRSNCPAHEPAPGSTGCRACWDLRGHDCGMEVQQ